MRKQHLKVMKAYLKNGATVKRTKKHKHGNGPKKTATFEKKFKIPDAGYIFKSRAGSATAHLHYHAIYDHIKREAPKFAKHLKDTGRSVGPEVAKLRPHSGRATLITKLTGEGMTTAMSMKYARHAPDSDKVHLKYGRLDLEDVKAACDSTQSSRPTARWTLITTKELLAAQRAITRELALRAKTTKQR